MESYYCAIAGYLTHRDTTYALVSRNINSRQNIRNYKRSANSKIRSETCFRSFANFPNRYENHNSVAGKWSD